MRAFNIPADALEPSLRRFSKQARIEVLFPTDVVAGRRAKAVKGEYTAQQALDVMLAGTGFRAFQDSRSGAITLIPDEKPTSVAGGGSAVPRIQNNNTPEHKVGEGLASMHGEGAVSVAPRPDPRSGPGTGSIAGRVFNPVTREYVRNAQVEVSGGGQVAFTAQDGSYSLRGVPAGVVTLSVIYTGYRLAAKRVTVEPGRTTVGNFELHPAHIASEAVDGEPVIELNRFVVSGYREGSAKAIMEQRAAVTFKNVVASDNFGDVTGGSVGEFIKYLPGVVMDYVDSDARTARIGGLSPVYAGVSVDGMNVANASDAGFNAESRAFEFEQASIVGVEAIEIIRTSTAAMDADSPAGRINLRSRSAFDRKGRGITAHVTFTGNEYSWSLKKTPGPYGTPTHKVRPGFAFTYSDVFREKLGVQLSLGGNTVATEQAGVTHFYNHLAGREPILTRILFRDAPKLSRRASFNFSAEYKASPHLTLSLRTSGAHWDDGTNLRQIGFLVDPGAVTPDSSATSLVAMPSANASSQVQYTTDRRNRANATVIYVPKLEYRRDDLVLTLGGGYSRSRTSFEDMSDGYFKTVAHRLTRIGFTAARSTATDTDWVFSQTSGPSWSEVKNYNRTSAFSNNVSSRPQVLEHQLRTMQFDAEKTVSILGQPVQILTGAKTREALHEQTKSGLLNWTYVGAAGMATAPDTVLPTTTQPGFDARTGGNIGALGIPMTDPYATYALFREHPSYFSPATVANYINENFRNRSVRERVDALYLEANARWRSLRMNLGMRREWTAVRTRTIDPRARSAVEAAGYEPDTLEFADYQYRHGLQTTRTGGYANTFLSGGIKYGLARSLDLQLAGSQSIGRPGFDQMLGLVVIDESNKTVRIANPNLRPETSDKIFAGLHYYFEPAGTLSFTGFRMSVRDMGIASTQISAVEAGYADDPGLAEFAFYQPTNAPGMIRINGFDVEYSQQLVFLPAPLRGLSVFGSFSRTAASERIEAHIPKSANGGIRYGNSRFNAQMRFTWQAARFDSTVESEEIWQYERLMFDFSGVIRLNDNCEFTITGRNIFNEPIRTYSNSPGFLRTINRYGAAWTVGIRQRF